MAGYEPWDPVELHLVPLTEGGAASQVPSCVDTADFPTFRRRQKCLLLVFGFFQGTLFGGYFFFNGKLLRVLNISSFVSMQCFQC